MKAIFQNSVELERFVKEKYHFPPYIMMENAASSMEIVLNSLVSASCTSKVLIKTKVLIVCGSGNNGADGIALARRIFGKYDVSVFLCNGDPKTDEGKVQFEMAKSVGVNFVNFDDFCSLLSNLSKNPATPSVIIDCIFGTGFHGELSEQISRLIEKLNATDAIRISCDIPSALAFKADATVTMGTLKTQLFSDKAKDFCGEIFIADLGINHTNFEKCGLPDAFLLEEQDMVLPFRIKKSSHKGNFGHTAVIVGEKCGAAILASAAALKSGSGLVTLVKPLQNTANSDISQFKIEASIMIGDDIPKNTSAILLGSGLGRNEENYAKAEKILEEYLCLAGATDKTDTSDKNDSPDKAKFPAVVLDADMMYCPKIASILDKLNTKDGAKIVLTPHLKELSSLSELCGFGTYSVSELSSIEVRLQLGKKFAARFPKTAIIMKSANTLVCVPANIATRSKNAVPNKNGEFFVVADGNPSLSKAGSGDVLAGTVASLLAQGYDLREASITATELHALSSVYSASAYADKKNRLQGDEFFLTAENLIENIEFIAHH